MVKALTLPFASALALAQVEQQPSFDEWAAENGMNGFDDSTRATYESNVRIIDALNAQDPSATYAVNKFSGMTQEEFAKIYLTLKTSPLASSGLPELQLESVIALQDADWDVTPAKDQGNCGSCWTFGVMGAIEGMNKVLTGTEVILSEQQLVDCDHEDNGCNGGMTDYAYKYLTGKDLYTLASYPYVSGQSGHGNSCKTGSPSGVTINGYFSVPGVNSGSRGDDALAKALMTGPVTISIAADNQFANYHTGIMTGVPTECNLNHAILATGYGPNFWKIKNSWGSSWGAGGFAKFERSTAGCGPFGIFFQDAGFQPQMGHGPAPTPTPPTPTPPTPTPTPTPPTPSPGGHHYGGPPCQSDEVVLHKSGDHLSMCTKSCGSTGDCPTDLPNGVSASPTCRSDSHWCVLKCSGDGECGEGGSCVWDQCWYPSSGGAMVSV